MGELALLGIFWEVLGTPILFVAAMCGAIVAARRERRTHPAPVDFITWYGGASRIFWTGFRIMLVTAVIISLIVLALATLFVQSGPY